MAQIAEIKQQMTLLASSPRNSMYYPCGNEGGPMKTVVSCELITLPVKGEIFIFNVEDFR